MPKPFDTEIAAACRTFDLDPALVAAQVHVESGGNSWAWNPESAWRYYWNVRTHKPFRAVTPDEMLSERPPSDFPSLVGDPDQEWWGQQASWGLLQIMGAVAREHGFGAPYLTELCDPIINLGLGCLHLSQLLKWADGDVAQALSAYNGGKFKNDKPPFRNQWYASKVLAAMRL